MSAARVWREEWNALLGTMQDAEVAHAIGVTRRTVSWNRARLGIKRCKWKMVPCSKCQKPIRRRICKNPTCSTCQRNNRLAYFSERYMAGKLAGVERPNWCATHKEQRRAWAAKYREANRERIRRQDNLRARKRAKADRALLSDLPCLDCGMKHTQERRATILRRMLPCHTSEIHEAWDCIWGPTGFEHKGSAGAQRLRRDLMLLGAVSVGMGHYKLPQRSAA
jgi:hypothetical protein